MKQMAYLSLTVSKFRNSSTFLLSLFCDEKSIKMGRHWGNIAKLSGITFFRLSPYEQRPFAGMIKDGIPNTIRRINEHILFVAPCFITAYVIQTWATHVNHQLHRKNPADFANDT